MAMRDPKDLNTSSARKYEQRTGHWASCQQDRDLDRLWEAEKARQREYIDTQKTERAIRELIEQLDHAKLPQGAPGKGRLPPDAQMTQALRHIEALLMDTENCYANAMNFLEEMENYYSW